MKANWKDIRTAPRDGRPILVIGVQAIGSENHWRRFITQWQDRFFAYGWSGRRSGEVIILWDDLPALAIVGES